MQIRELPRTEWQKLKDITLESLQTEPQAFATTYEKKLAFDEYKWMSWLLPLSGLSKSLTLFAVDEADAVFGKATALFGDKQSIEIVGMYVRGSERRQGTGQKLLEALLKRIVPMYPNRKVILEVSTDQEFAVALYQKMGFQEISNREAKMGDGKMHMVMLMELRN